MLNQYKLFDGTKVIREPFFRKHTKSKRISIYHPINNEIYFPTKTEWMLIEKIQAKQEINLELDAKTKRTIRVLEQNHIIQKTDEKISIDLKYTPDNAQMYVKLTEACNFACPGCTTSIDRIPLNKAITLDIRKLEIYLESFVRSASEKNMNTVKIKWAGGEPLLKMSYDLIQAAQEIIKSLRTKYPKINIKQIVLTNGVFLTPDKAKFLKEHGISLSVSLWGTGLVQDNARKPRNRMETYDVIIKNISNIENLGLDYSVNYVLTPTNAHNFPEFIETMWDISSPKFIGKHWTNKHPVTVFIAFFRPQSGISKELSERMYAVMLQGLKNGFRKIKSLIKKQIPIQSLNIIDYINLTGIALYTCGSGINYVACGPEGAAPCHEDLFEMKDNFNRILNGENIIDMVNEKYADTIKYLNGLTYLDDKDFDYIFLHGGLGCPRLRKAENNGDISKLGSTTEFYKSFIDDLLGLESLRIKTNQKNLLTKMANDLNEKNLNTRNAIGIEANAKKRSQIKHILHSYNHLIEKSSYFNGRSCTYSLFVCSAISAFKSSMLISA
jgi:sulfatase maturation enzyme AslB (radical SAM superfamily)